MKASDFTTGGNDREKAMSNLLKTEKTDAVNTGLVEKADKSAKALKGDLYSVGKKGTHGAGSTALDAIARKRKKTSAADALDGKSRSQITGKNALTKKVQSRHNLNKSLKHGANVIVRLRRVFPTACIRPTVPIGDELLDSISTSAVECFRPPPVIFITPILKYRELGDTVLDDVPSHRPHLLEKLRGGGNHGD